MRTYTMTNYVKEAGLDLPSTTGFSLIDPQPIVLGMDTGISDMQEHVTIYKLIIENAFAMIEADLGPDDFYSIFLEVMESLEYENRDIRFFKNNINKDFINELFNFFTVKLSTLDSKPSYHFSGFVKDPKFKTMDFEFVVTSHLDNSTGDELQVSIHNGLTFVPVSKNVKG